MVPSAKHVVSHFRWCPVNTQSGVPGFVRRAVWMPAVEAVRQPGSYREYFLCRTGADKNEMDSLVAVGRKILASHNAILKTGRADDPAYTSCAAHPIHICAAAELSQVADGRSV